MKKAAAAGIIAICALLFMVNCSGGNRSQRNIIEIRERMFIGQINEIYLNAEEYIGRTIKLEGIFQTHQSGEGQFYSVVRNGPGCCGDDGLVGFEVAWAENQRYPEHNAWVEAIGVLQLNRASNYISFPYLDLTSLTELNRRGREFVNQ